MRAASPAMVVAALRMDHSSGVKASISSGAAEVARSLTATLLEKGENSGE